MEVLARAMERSDRRTGTRGGVTTAGMGRVAARSFVVLTATRGLGDFRLVGGSSFIISFSFLQRNRWLVDCLHL